MPVNKLKNINNHLFSNIQYEDILLASVVLNGFDKMKVKIFSS